MSVEVSTDGGQTWNPAQGTTSWSFSYTPAATGPVTIESRAVDSTVNLGPPSAGVTVTVTQPTTSLTIFGLGATPTAPATNDPTPTELGVRFSSDVSGYITGIRFFKGTGNIGTHIGNLWTSTGTLLATVTFTDETVSGWQEADFSTPVAVTASTTCVASYYAPAGDYAADTYYFALSGVNSGPLHVGLDLPNAPASVFLQGSNGFPTNTFNSTNYWVDAVFSATASVAPRVTTVSPLPGANGTASNTTVTARFNEPIQIGSLLFLLTDSNGNVVAANVNYDASTQTATLTSNASLNYPATYTATVSGAQDQNGLAMTSSVSWSFNTSYQPGSAYTLWGNSVRPTVAWTGDDQPTEVGVLFESTLAGSIAGIRFYDADPFSIDGDDGDGADTYVVHLWTASGTLLATANYALNDDSSLGWQQANFKTPVSIAANTVYVASYYTVGGYAQDVGYFENAGVTTGPLHALSATEVGNLDNVAADGNGVFVMGTGGGFPTNTYAGSNYWVDVAFNTGSGVAPPPAVTAESPTAGASRHLHGHVSAFRPFL